MQRPAEPDRFHRLAAPRHVFGERGQQRQRLFQPLDLRRRRRFPTRAAAPAAPRPPAPAPPCGPSPATARSSRPCHAPAAGCRRAPGGPRRSPRRSAAAVADTAARPRPRRILRARRCGPLSPPAAPATARRPAPCPAAARSASARQAAAHRPAPSPPRNTTGKVPSPCSRSTAAATSASASRHHRLRRRIVRRATARGAKAGEIGRPAPVGQRPRPRPARPCSASRAAPQRRLREQSHPARAAPAPEAPRPIQAPEPFVAQHEAPAADLPHHPRALRREDRSGADGRNDPVARLQARPSRRSAASDVTFAARKGQIGRQPRRHLPARSPRPAPAPRAGRRSRAHPAGSASAPRHRMLAARRRRSVAIFAGPRPALAQNSRPTRPRPPPGSPFRPRRCPDTAPWRLLSAIKYQNNTRWEGQS